MSRPPPPEYRTGLSWFIRSRGSFIRMTMTWWSSRGLIMPSHMRYHSRRGQWSPCSKVLLLIWCHWLHDDWEKIFFRREIPLTWWKTTKPIQTDRVTDTWFEIPGCFCLPMMMDGADLTVCIQQVQLYTGLCRCKWASKNISFSQNTLGEEMAWDFLGLLEVSVKRGDYLINSGGTIKNWIIYLIKCTAFKCSLLIQGKMKVIYVSWV